MQLTEADQTKMTQYHDTSIQRINKRWPSITSTQAMKKDDQDDWINKGCGQLCKKLCRRPLFVAGDTSTQDFDSDDDDDDDDDCDDSDDDDEDREHDDAVCGRRYINPIF